MKGVFIESSTFEMRRENYLTDDEYRLFQAELM